MKDNIVYADWQKIDIRLGKILEASNPDWSNKLIHLKVDFGAEVGERNIFTGLRSWYNPEQFVGRQCLFVINLAPKKMGEFESQGMILALDPEPTEAGNSAPLVLMFDDIAKEGTPLA